MPASGDTLQFDGTTGATNLALTYTTATSNTLGGAAGISLNVAAGQTGTVSIVSGQTGNNTIAIRLGTTALTVASGAGAVTFGNGGANVLPLVFGAATSTQLFTNNNAPGVAPVTFNSDVSFVPGGAAAHFGQFAGTGDFVLNNVITNTGVGSGGTLGFSNTGSGTVTFNGANSTFNGAVTIGTANASSVIRAGATQALGTAVIGILGNGAATQVTSNRLELTGGITLNNAITLSGKTATGTGASILNIAGANTLSGAVTPTTGGTFYTLQSNAGTLTVSNAAGFSLTTLTGTRTLTLQGAGGGSFTGPLSNGTSTGILALVKDGAGTWTLNAASTYSGGTTVTGGILAVTANGTLGSGSVTVATTAISLTIGTGVTNPFTTGAATTLFLAGDGVQNNAAASGFLNLSGANITVAGLTLGGVSEPAGVYTAATFPDYIVGTGTVTVLVPEPGTWALMSGGLLGLLVCSRAGRIRRQQA